MWEKSILLLLHSLEGNVSGRLIKGTHVDALWDVSTNCGWSHASSLFYLLLHQPSERLTILHPVSLLSRTQSGLMSVIDP